MYFDRGGTFCLEGTPGCHPLTGVQYTGWSQGATTLDYDLDGDVDVLEASEFNTAGLRLWENDGSGFFSNVAAARSLPGAGTALNCVVTGDVDNDGDVDVYTWFDNNGTRAGRLYRNEIACRPDVQPGCTPAGTGKRFTLVNTQLGGAEHMFFADLDNDGDLDLVSGGVFLNNGNGTFVADSTTGLLAEGRGGMALDADGDGDLGVVMNHSDRTHPYRGFFVNQLASGLNHLKVKLTGRGGQAGAPGAKVSVYEAGFLGDPLHLLGYREVVTATGGFVDGPSPLQHFGLGTRTAADVRAVFVTGEVVEETSVPANTRVHLQADGSSPDTTPPVISNVASGAMTQTGATVTWTTNEASDSQVEYGLTASYGSLSPLNAQLVTSHAVGLTGLAAGTTYHFRVRSRDAAGNLAVGNDSAFNTLAAGPLFSDSFPGNALDTTKWVKGTNAGNQAAVVNGQLELRSQGRQTACVVTRNRFTARNTIVAVKVTRPNSDGDLGMSPSYTASSTTGIYGGSPVWYRFYTYRSGSSGPYRLFAQWKKNGVVNGLDVTGSLVINGLVHLRLRMDTTRVHFEASLDGTAWVDTYNETFSLPGYTLADGFHYELAGYNTLAKGVLRVDDFSISAGP